MRIIFAMVSSLGHPRTGLHPGPCGCVLMMVLWASTLAAADGWKAGVGRADITPIEPMWMAGYASRDRPVEGKLTELWAKTLVLEDAHQNRGLLITLDLVGIGQQLSATLCEQIGTRFGFQRDEIAICTSHTHSGPIVGRALEPMSRALVPESQQKLVDQYADFLVAQVLDAVGRAVNDLKPAQLQHGSGVATFAVNRRNNSELEVPAQRAAGTLVGPSDHDVPVLAVRLRDGKLIAVLFGYACHATVLSGYQWSGDYPGYAQRDLERLYPGCQAMFWAGCGADQNPVPRRTVELAEHYGRRLAAAVETVLLTHQLSELAARMETSYTEIDVPFSELPTREELQHALQSDNRYEQSRARLLLDRIDAGEPLAATYRYPVGVWKLGSEVTMILLGGEVVVDYALRLKDELPGTSWVVGYSNDVMAYIPSRRVLREGGYEGATAMVYYGLPTTWDPGIEEAIVGEVHRQVALASDPQSDDSL